MRNTFLLVALLLLLTGCASTSLYNWGHYEDDLFDYYYQPEHKAKVIEDLVEHLQKQETNGTKPAPGLYAEAGTFYLLEGDTETAIRFYEQEARHWPESEPMMSTLIHNLEAN
ncbi:MAG: DUF4810 domain-containing protein [Reinekea sp.]|jgi:hypothetical protein